jgi:predicted ATPase
MHSEISEIERKMVNAPWPKFLRSVSIDGLRGWTGQEVRFEFPVVAIAGENGCGKSTVLKVSAAAYNHPTDRNLTFYPGNFFPDTAWETISGVALRYRIRQGNDDRNFAIRKLTSRWRFPERPDRNVVFQDVSRTLPMEATVGYARIARRNATETGAQALSTEITRFYSSIMGRRYDEARIAKSNLDSERSVGVVRLTGAQFSQFHQGAGEDATLDLLSLLQNVPDTSLILIDEVEASLHPRSQRRLMHFLLWLARTKHIQVIVSTHSSYVLDELPFKARVFLARGMGGIEVFYGISTNYAMNLMDDLNRPDLFLFTEDVEASLLVTELLRESDIQQSRIKIIEVGPSNMVETLGNLAQQRRLPFNALGILDPDKAQRPGCAKIPGQHAPEKQVIQDILDNGSEDLASRLGLSVNSVRDCLTSASTLTDHHEWVGHAARQLAQTNAYLWTTMCQVWLRNCIGPEVRSSFVDEVRRSLR